MISNYIACGYQSCNQPVRETAHFLAMKLGDDTLFTFHGAKQQEGPLTTLPKWRLAACCYVRWGSMQIWWVQEHSIHSIGPNAVKKSENNTETS
jgi:hypothetical protein